MLLKYADKYQQPVFFLSNGSNPPGHGPIPVHGRVGTGPQREKKEKHN